MLILRDILNNLLNLLKRSVNKIYYKFYLKDNIAIITSNRLLTNFIVNRVVYRKEIETIINIIDL